MLSSRLSWYLWWFAWWLFSSLRKSFYISSFNWKEISARKKIMMAQEAFVGKNESINPIHGISLTDAWNMNTFKRCKERFTDLLPKRDDEREETPGLAWNTDLGWVRVHPESSQVWWIDRTDSSQLQYVVKKYKLKSSVGKGMKGKVQQEKGRAFLLAHSQRKVLGSPSSDKWHMSKALLLLDLPWGGVDVC